MRFTTDESLIRERIEEKTVIDGFCDGEPIKDLTDMLFLYNDIAMFGIKTDKGFACIHAAIPKKNRGKAALMASREAVNILLSLGYTVVTQIKPNMKKERVFANMAGFKPVGKKGEHILYRWSA